LGEVGKCPKCGGEMREGELIVKVTEGSSKTDPFMKAMMTRTGDFASILEGSQEEPIVIEGPLWQEQTDKEGGWLIKRKEIKVLPLMGKRCISCGYIELYVKEK